MEIFLFLVGFILFLVEKIAFISGTINFTKDLNHVHNYDSVLRTANPNTTKGPYNETAVDRIEPHYVLLQRVVQRSLILPLCIENATAGVLIVVPLPSSLNTTSSLIMGSLSYHGDRLTTRKRRGSINLLFLFYSEHRMMSVKL